MFLPKQLLHTHNKRVVAYILCKTLFVTPTHTLRGHVKFKFYMYFTCSKIKKKQYTTVATRFFFLNRFCESLSEDVPIYTDDR